MNSRSNGRLPKKGGANKKMKKYPRIGDYLQAHHPKVYELFDNCSMTGNLTPRRGGSITFLLPDATYVKEIEKAIESDEPEKATDMLSSLILTDLFTKTEDFASKKDDIPNLLGKKLIVKSVTSSKILIEDGELTLDTDFQPFSRQGNAKRGNMAVWKLKGKVEYEKAPAATMKYTKGGKKGGNSRVGGDEDNLEELQWIKKKIINEKILCLKSDKRSADGCVYCPVMNGVTRILRVFGNKNDPTYFEEYRRARCILTMCPMIDFYLLFCNPLVFSPEKILSAYQKGLDQDRNADTYREFYSDFSHPAFSGEPSMLLKADGIETVNMARDKIRNSFMNRISKDTPNKILKAYIDIDTNNTMGSVGPIYPAGLHNVFMQNKNLHLLIDEFCHLVYSSLMYEVKTAPSSEEKAKRLMDLIVRIHDSYGSLSDPVKKTKLDKPESYGLSIDNQALDQCVISFWRTWGLHMPCNLNHEFEDRVKVGGDDEEDHRELVDIDGYIAGDLDMYNNCPCEVSGGAIAEVLAYKKAHGRLPPGLD